MVTEVFPQTHKNKSFKNNELSHESAYYLPLSQQEEQKRYWDAND